MCDVRKPAEQYVNDKLEQIIAEAFDCRKELEKNMGRRELLAFDRVLHRHLSQENLLPVLKNAVHRDYAEFDQGKQLVQADADRQNDLVYQMKKTAN